MPVRSGVSRMGTDLGRGQAGKRIRKPHIAVADASRAQHATHEDACPAAPHASLDEVAGDSVGEHLLNARPEIGEASTSHHCVREYGPVPTLIPVSHIGWRSEYCND